MKPSQNREVFKPRSREREKREVRLREGRDGSLEKNIQIAEGGQEDWETASDGERVWSTWRGQRSVWEGVVGNALLVCGPDFPSTSELSLNEH